MLEMVVCKLDRVVNAGAGVPKVTASPAELACMAGELDLLEVVAAALEMLVMDGECRAPGELIEAAEEELRMPGELIVAEGLLRMTDANVTDGD